METPVLIDTSAWVCFFARSGYVEVKEAVSHLLDENRAAVAGPIVVELVQGARAERERDFLKSRFEGLHWLSITDVHWYDAAELSFRLRRRGIAASIIDVLLAAVAISYQCTIFHKDSDYELIARHSVLKLFKG